MRATSESVKDVLFDGKGLKYADEQTDTQLETVN